MTPQPHPDPLSALTVRALRHGVAELSAANAAVRRAHDREQRIRRICERYWDSPAARRIVTILDERTTEPRRDA